MIIKYENQKYNVLEILHSQKKMGLTTDCWDGIPEEEMNHILKMYGDLFDMTEVKKFYNDDSLTWHKKLYLSAKNLINQHNELNIDWSWETFLKENYEFFGSSSISY
ncbi:MAG: hypothetical protein GY756_20380 [bacterium]|nr:hypothetical protein [bacterium]